MIGLLNKSKAPFSAAVWDVLEDAAVQALEPRLSARRVVDVSGPHGFELAAANTGLLDARASGKEGRLEWSSRAVNPLVEARVPFEVQRTALDALARGSDAVDLGGLDEATATMARFEEKAVYGGFPGGAIRGLQDASEHKPLPFPKDPADLPKRVGEGVEQLQKHGIGGPYALITEPDSYFALQHTVSSGVPLMPVVHEILDGDVHWSPGIQGGVIVSTRGGDARLVLGQDISMGYTAHDTETVTLFMLESFTFQVLDPAAAVHIESNGKKRKG